MRNIHVTLPVLAGPLRDANSGYVNVCQLSKRLESRSVSNLSRERSLESIGRMQAEALFTR